jgi:RNA polymerase sigma-70 factor, ECF subfamily
MDREDELARAYTRIRPRLTRMAYTVLGSRAEAEDVVSECWLRLSAADRRQTVTDVEGWSVVVVARRALDVLRSARIQRRAYAGPWLPEPVIDTAVDPAERVTLDESVSFALLVVLESLTPAERTAWVLHDIFGLPFSDIAEVVGRQSGAVRQLAARARAHVRAAAPRVDVDAAEHRRAVAAFFQAAMTGDLAGLVAALDPAVVLTSDGGGQAGIARRPVEGAERVAAFLLAIIAKIAAGQRILQTEVNGGPGFTVVEAEPDGGERVVAVGCLTTGKGLIRRVDLVMATEKMPPARSRRSVGRSGRRASLPDAFVDEDLLGGSSGAGLRPAR